MTSGSHRDKCVNSQLNGRCDGGPGEEPTILWWEDNIGFKLYILFFLTAWIWRKWVDDMGGAGPEE